MHKIDVEAVIDRLKKVLDARSDTALAKALGTTPQTLSSWKSRGSVPYALCVEVSDKHGVSLDWLIRGKSNYESPVTSALEVRDTGTSYGLSPREQAVLDLFNNLNPEQQKEVLRDAEEKQRIAEMEKNLKELQAQMDSLKKMG